MRFLKAQGIKIEAQITKILAPTNLDGLLSMENK